MSEGSCCPWLSASPWCQTSCCGGVIRGNVCLQSYLSITVFVISLILLTSITLLYLDALQDWGQLSFFLKEMANKEVKHRGSLQVRGCSQVTPPFRYDSNGCMTRAEQGLYTEKANWHSWNSWMGLSAQAFIQTWNKSRSCKAWCEFEKVPRWHILDGLEKEESLMSQEPPLHWLRHSDTQMSLITHHARQEHCLLLPMSYMAFPGQEDLSDIFINQ